MELMKDHGFEESPNGLEKAALKILNISWQ